jgi:hypothetical protein
MTQPHQDAVHHPPSGSDEAHDAVVLPFPHTPRGTGPSSIREGQPGRWRVVRIDTEPMTAQHYDQAVTTLAALITQWKHNHENTNEAHKKAA